MAALILRFSDEIRDVLEEDSILAPLELLPNVPLPDGGLQVWGLGVRIVYMCIYAYISTYI